MARYTFGGTLYDIVATEDALNSDALVLVPSTVVPFYDADGVALSDFMLWNGAEDAYTLPATSISTDAEGFLPAFQGPDGLDTIYDAGGRALVARNAPTAGGGSGTLSAYSEVEVLPDYPTSFPPSTHTHAQADVTGLATALAGKASTTHAHDDRYYTETEINDMLAAGGVGGDYPAPRNVYEQAGTLPTRTATGIPLTTPIRVILELGSTKDPYSATYGYVPGFDEVGRTVLA